MEFCESNNSNDWDWDAISHEVINTFSLEISSENDKISTVEELKDLVKQGAKSILSFKRIHPMMICLINSKNLYYYVP